METMGQAAIDPQAMNTLDLQDGATDGSKESLTSNRSQSSDWIRFRTPCKAYRNSARDSVSRQGG